jgi:hypothetical protein
VHFPTILTHILLYIKSTRKSIKNGLFFRGFSMKFWKTEIFCAMEVFGLLNLLKNVLESAPAPTADAPTTEEKHAPPPPEEPQAPARNPYLDFAAAHDARARKIKRK